MFTSININAVKPILKIILAAVLFFSILPLFPEQELHAAEPTKVKFIRYANRKYLNFADVAKYFNMTSTQGLEYATMRNSANKFTFRKDKRLATFNNTNVTLHYPLLRRNSVFYISYYDFATNLRPLLQSSSLTKHRVKTIIIDPGHGGKDAGAGNRSIKEKDITLSVSRKLKTSLEKMGFKVILVRNSDREIELQSRAKTISRYNADLFISIHVNSAASASARGIETYCLTPVGAPGSHSNTVVKMAEQGNKNNANNFLLAYLIQKNLVDKTDNIDRGVKRAKFVVLKDAKCPAVLVELGFISNYSEYRQLTSSAFQNKIVSGITNAILQYSRKI